MAKPYRTVTVCDACGAELSSLDDRPRILSVHVNLEAIHATWCAFARAQLEVVAA